MKLEEYWYSKPPSGYPFWYWLLLPLTYLFACLSASRRMLFKAGVLSSDKPKVPIIIVGNIGIGGNGKTPLTLLLVEYALSIGAKPGVLSRGYGGNQRIFPHRVNSSDDASLVGDEPLLMSKRLDVPVVIDPKRSRGAHFMHEHCDCDLIICDDGLQHYALGRDFEIVVTDKRGFGNQRLLPMGPLREGVWRLSSVDAIVSNTGTSLSQQVTSQTTKTLEATKYHEMQLLPDAWVNLKTAEVLSLERFKTEVFDKHRNSQAIAGIGDPKRFFETLSSLDLIASENKAFADHHAFSASDLGDGLVLMTEKDAVKCHSFCTDKHWYLKISASIDETFLAKIKAVYESI